MCFAGSRSSRSRSSPGIDSADATPPASRARIEQIGPDNCRRVEGSRSWSQHAYGRAIDLNPVENPYVSGADV